MAVLFPTREAGKQGRRMGQPRQADPCACEHPIHLTGDDLETCKRCGHFALDEIRHTWATQARQFAGAQSMELVAA